MSSSQGQASRLAPHGQRHAQRGADQEGALAIGVDVGEALGGDQERLLGRVGGGVGLQPAAAQRPPDQRVMGDEHPLQPLAIGRARAARR